MDELRGPTIQIILHVKEGLGFGFLKAPFVVAGSLNGYLLETDPVIPSHAPFFDAELVWEADKRKFRNLRVQNVPIKVEVFTMATQGRKDKVGYLLLSLLGAQPCPSNRIVDIKYTFHKLLGVKSEGKCCHPQLMLSLSVEDRTNNLTPRNELRMFHSNEVACPRSEASVPPARPALMTFDEYIAESGRRVTSQDLQPRLLCDEGVIQIGAGTQQFVLSFVIGTAENVDLLLPDHDPTMEGHNDCYITYSVFNNDIMTDRVATSIGASGHRVATFNQRTSLRVRTELTSLARYFTECPLVVVKLCAGARPHETDVVGVCSMDLRKLVPTQQLQQFKRSFCNEGGDALRIHERCYLLPRAPPRGEGVEGGARRAFVDVDMRLKCVADTQQNTVPKALSARSASQLEASKAPTEDKITLEYKGGSCTELDKDVGGNAYVNITPSNTNRYKMASGETAIPSGEIAELIRKMCDSLALSQDKLLAETRCRPSTCHETRCRPSTCDAEVQCERCTQGGTDDGGNVESELVNPEVITPVNDKEEPKLAEKEMVKSAIPAVERDVIMHKFIEELEDWKENQQQLYKIQLMRKEEYHLELLASEWTKKRVELESKLSRGIEQCRTLAADLSRATDDFRLRGYRNTEREKKLLEAKKALEVHYTSKFQELREASLKMEQDMQHQLRVKDMKVEELECKVATLERQVDALKTNLKNIERDAESKYSGLTKDQTASLIQELRSLEEKLDTAVQSKCFFKEQWGRAVRELHLLKLSDRRHMLAQLREDRRQLGHCGLGTITNEEEGVKNNLEQHNINNIDIKRLKDDYFVDLLVNTPDLDANPLLGTDGMENIYGEMREAPKHPASEKLNALIAKREKLVNEENPDENKLKQLNNEIRNILLNYGT